MQSLPVLKNPSAKEAPEITAFVKLVQQGVDAWTEAGKHLVIMLGKDKDFLVKMRRAHPEISADMLLVFERIGRRQIYAPLLANNSMGARALLELPYEAQERFCKSPVPVVVRKGGAFVTENKHIHELSRAEVKQVFDPDAVVPPERQEKRLREQVAIKSPVRIQAAPAFVKREEVACYRFFIKDGQLKAEKTEKNGREYSVRMVDGKNGMEALVAFYK